MLELGPGPGGRTSEFLAGWAARLTGLDIDDSVRGNHWLDEALVYGGDVFPFRNECFDAVVADYVVEHLADPERIFLEIGRVLKPGGVFLFRTPNVWHYVSMGARIMPEWISSWARDGESRGVRTYATFYRCNSLRCCRRRLGRAGMEIVEYKMIEKEPSYGRRSRLLFMMMALYERVVNATRLLAWARANILCAARKAVRPEPLGSDA